jgi:hypothetical protein
MELARKAVVPRDYLTGNEFILLPEKAKVRVQTKALGGGEWVVVLDATVPNNKTWNAQISILIEET